MVKLESLFAFMGSNFDYLLAVDRQRRVTYLSELLIRDCFSSGFPSSDTVLDNYISKQSLKTFQSAMTKVQVGERGVVLLSPFSDESHSIPLKAGFVSSKNGETYIFFGNRVGYFDKQSESEKDERIKELTCLYEVDEWIEVSKSIKDFFTELPKYLASGMLFSEETVVYSIFQGVEYGQEISSDNSISVRLTINQQDAGEIRVGYHNNTHELLPEEQKMLNEIGRTLNLALERKELEDKMLLKQEEEAQYNAQLESLKKEIESRTREIEDQKSKLGIVDSYLDKMNRGWEESKTRLETMFKAIPDDVMLIDRNHKIVMTNRKDLKPGEDCYRSYFGRDLPCEDCRLARILKKKTPLTITMKHEDRYLQVHAMPVYNQDQEVDGILEFYRDVTLEKTYEQQLQQADKLASLGQLVSGIGHEINNPNQFIRGNIKIISQALDDMLPIIDEHYASHPDLKIARLNYDFFRQHIMTLVDDMSHGSERIKGIVEGLRGFARKDEGLLVDNVDINTLIEASTRLVHNEVHKRADIVLDLSKKLPTFTGNSQKIEQVLINLIVNASHAMLDDRKGVITVRTRSKESNVLVEVEDNGKGMNEKTLKQIFDPFFTTKRAKGGTGLGLAIAYRIIEEHGGSISVTSKPGTGTTFTIRIPAGTEVKAAVGSQ